MAGRDKVRYTTYISKRHLELLHKLGEETDLPICTILGIALDDYLMELRRLSEPLFPPINKEYLKSRSPKRKEPVS